MAGEQGRFFALGTTSGETRGISLPNRLRDGPEIIGVLAVKFTVDAFEDAWRNGSNEIMVLDDAGVIFMASRPQCISDRLAAQPRARAAIEDTKKYPMDQLVPLQATQEPFDTEFRRVAITSDTGSVERYMVQRPTDPRGGMGRCCCSRPANRPGLRAIGTVGDHRFAALAAGFDRHCRDPAAPSSLQEPGFRSRCPLQEELNTASRGARRN